MKSLFIIFLATIFSFQLSAQVPATTAPKIEIVFCLDATGSMAGLIATAKEKIWEIVTRLTQTDPAPEIKVGMVFYRDRGDAFVTTFCPLTTDIDSIYGVLLSMAAAGGGDTPESVNQALHEAVSKMKWSQGNAAYKTIFLVGDCPPHMDYPNDILYSTSCAEAKQKNIFINTIKLGLGCDEAIQHFQSIASSTKGEYIQIGQNADDVIVKTPFDDSVNYYSLAIDASMIYYGSKSLREYNEVRKEKSELFYSSGSVSSNADRAEFNNSSSGKGNWFGTNELILDLSEGKITVDSLKKEMLSEALSKMTKEELKVHLAKKVQERKTNLANLDRLTKARARYLAEEKGKTKVKDGFSDRVFKIVQGQAKGVGVVIGR
jgi:Mg-chelatase subunit ChlD